MGLRCAGGFEYGGRTEVQWKSEAALWKTPGRSTGLPHQRARKERAPDIPRGMMRGMSGALISQ